MTSIPDVISYISSISQLLLTFSLEFSDIIVASCEHQKTVDLLKAFILQLTFLARPFPQLETYTVDHGGFTKNAVMAFAELAVGITKIK